jgi:transcription antitermination factor NusG
MNQFNWYAAYTYPRHEKKVLEQLVLREIESFLPCYRALHQWRNGCKVEVQLPLFPGYVFVRVRLQEQLRVLQVPNLVKLIGFGGPPVALPTEEIEALRAALSTLKAEPHPFLKVGDRVRIKSGCLAGTEGILLRKATGFRFVLNVDLLMQAASVEVSAEDVEPMALISQASAPTASSRPC